MQTTQDILRQAARDLRQRIFQKSIFHHKHMKDMAQALAREYSSGMSSENLRSLSRHDTWLSRMSRSDRQGENVGCVETDLFNFLKAQLRILVEGFWEGRTAAEFVVRSSSIELAGFFNGERPCRQVPANDPHDDAHKRSRAPYV